MGTDRVVKVTTVVTHVSFDLCFLLYRFPSNNPIFFRGTNNLCYNHS